MPCIGYVEFNVPNIATTAEFYRAGSSFNTTKSTDRGPARNGERSSQK